MSLEINKTFSKILDEIGREDFEQRLVQKDLLLEQDAQ